MSEWVHVFTLIASGLLIPAVTALIAAFGVLWRKIQVTEQQHVECLDRNAKMQVEVVTVKSFIQSRAFLEALGQGRMRVGGEPTDFASQFQQVYVDKREREAFADLMPELRSWYMGKGMGQAPRELTDDQLFMAIMRDWDSTFVSTVCQRLHIANAACVLYAMCLLKETQEHDAHGNVRQG